MEGLDHEYDVLIPATQYTVYDNLELDDLIVAFTVQILRDASSIAESQTSMGEGWRIRRGGAAYIASRSMVFKCTTCKRSLNHVLMTVRNHAVALRPDFPIRILAGDKLQGSYKAALLRLLRNFISLLLPCLKSNSTPPTAPWLGRGAQGPHATGV